MKMKEYILSIVSVILLTAAVGIILPEGKTGKFIKGIFAVATLVVILTPLTKIGDYIPAFETESGDVEIGYDEEYLDYMYDKKSEVYAAEIESYIQEKGCESDVEIVYDCADYEFHIVKVSTNLYFSGISEEDEHIYIMSEIQKAVAQYCGIEEEKVQINEIFIETEKQ